LKKIAPTSPVHYNQYMRIISSRDSSDPESRHSWNALRRFLAYVKPYTSIVVLATLCGITKFLLPLTMAVSIRFITDELVTQTDGKDHDISYRLTMGYIQWISSLFPANWNASSLWGQLNILMGSLVLIYVIWALTQFGRTYLSQLAGHRVILDLRTDLYSHITRQSHSFFQTRQSGGIVSRLMSDIALAQNFVGSAMTAIWMDLAICIVYIALLFSMDVPLAWASIAVFPLYIASMKRYGRAAKRTTKAAQEALEEFSGDVQERVAGIGVVKSFAMERREAKSFFSGARGLYDLTMRGVRITAASNALAQWLTQMAKLVVLWFGASRVLSGETTTGTVLSIMFLLPELYGPMNRIAEMNTVLNNSLAAIDRVFEVFDIEPDVVQKTDAQKLGRIEGRVTFENVTFGYEPERPILSDVTVDIKPGEVIALVGASGAGKSTLVQLIPRFYDPQQGRVLVDGLDVRDVNLRSLRSQIGMVAQETLLFSGTARENLLYGRPDATEEELVQAARAAHAHEFLEELEDGYDSVLGERGAKLSGGQKQRLAIARAFLTDPRILILDEATSALDSESEALIQEALNELMKGRTNVVIAHRLSTILGADRIAVMHQGKIVDIGSHKELLVRCRRYANLYNTQFKVALAG
jgi:subfamily B ATP-binding cassette protein MsbA